MLVCCVVFLCYVVFGFVAPTLIFLLIFVMLRRNADMNIAWIVITQFYVQVLDSETWSLVFKDPLSTPSPLYTLAPLEHGAVSGDEDGTVKIWDFR